MRFLTSRLFTLGNVATLLLLAAILAWFILLRPSFLGGGVTYVMIAGDSMEPTLHNGDLVLARSQDAYHVGDLVAFHVPDGERGEGAMVIHRIVDGTAADGFTTQGDNNDWLDPWNVGAADIVGERWFGVPGAGRWLDALRTPVLLAGLVGSLVVSLILMGEGRRRSAGPRVERTAALETMSPAPAPLTPSRTAARAGAIPWNPLLLAMWVVLTAVLVRTAGSLMTRQR